MKSVRNGEKENMQENEEMGEKDIWRGKRERQPPLSSTFFLSVSSCLSPCLVLYFTLSPASFLSISYSLSNTYLAEYFLKRFPFRFRNFFCFFFLLICTRFVCIILCNGPAGVIDISISAHSKFEKIRNEDIKVKW